MGKLHLRTMKSRNRMTKREIEVETKFHVENAEEIEQRLVNLGAKRLSVQSFTDSYYDSDNPHITLQDYWLRYRKCNIKGAGSWQLKKPAVYKPTDRVTSIYEEVKGISAVEEALAVLDSSNMSERQSILVGNDISLHLTADELVAKHGLVCFAEFSTRRTGWIVANPIAAIGDDSSCHTHLRNLKVDLDGTDFGHSVGEVEAIVSDEDDIADARQTIDLLMKTLGVENSQGGNSVEGKLHIYMRTNRPEHYQACVDAGCL